MSLSQEYIDLAYEILVLAAIKGERCPANSHDGVDGIPDGATGALRAAGKIKVEIYARNYRVVEILTGPFAGKRTAPPPNPNLKPYLILGQTTERKWQMSA